MSLLLNHTSAKETSGSWHARYPALKNGTMSVTSITLTLGRQCRNSALRIIAFHPRSSCGSRKHNKSLLYIFWWRPLSWDLLSLLSLHLFHSDANEPALLTFLSTTHSIFLSITPATFYCSASFFSVFVHATSPQPLVPAVFVLFPEQEVWEDISKSVVLGTPVVLPVPT